MPGKTITKTPEKIQTPPRAPETVQFRRSPGFEVHAAAGTIPFTRIVSPDTLVADSEEEKFVTVGIHVRVLRRLVLFGGDGCLLY